jgi:hypothetical protein
VIDEIEKELKRISPWPWRWDGRTIRRVDYDTLHHLVDDAMFEATQNFIAKSPERIAALVEYVNANEFACWGKCICDPQGRCLDRISAARAKLGLK